MICQFPYLFLMKSYLSNIWGYSYVPSNACIWFHLRSIEMKYMRSMIVYRISRLAFTDCHNSTQYAQYMRIFLCSKPFHLVWFHLIDAQNPFNEIATFLYGSVANCEYYNSCYHFCNFWQVFLLFFPNMFIVEIGESKSVGVDDLW